MDFLRIYVACFCRYLSLPVTLMLTLFTSPLSAVEVTPQSFEKTARATDESTLIVPRLPQPPVIDGNLNDAAWDKAAVAKSFWRGGTTDLAEEQTIVWAAFDQQNLYFAFACQDAKVTGGAYERDSRQIWQHDEVEVHILPERDPKRGRQFILGAGGSRYDAMGAEKMSWQWNPEPDWEGAVQKQPWGYMAEMRIPLAALIDTRQFDVGRGTNWQIKVARVDYGDHKGGRLSSWTPISDNTSDRYAAGDLIFEDANLVWSGNAESLSDKAAPAGWEINARGIETKLERTNSEKTEGEHAIKVTVNGTKGPGKDFRFLLGKIAPVRQPVETTYLFSADVKVDAPADKSFVAYAVIVNGSQNEGISIRQNAGWQTIKGTITVEAGRQPELPRIQGAPVASLLARENGGGVIYIDNVRLVAGDLSQVTGDPDSFCLTGNATGAFRTRNKAVDGTYTYTEPMTISPEYPIAPLGTTTIEPGLYRGPIPFSEGRLTDGMTSTISRWGMFWTGNLGHDINFDLGDNYEITRIEIIGGSIGRENIYLKSPGEPRFTLVAAKLDSVAYNTGRSPEEFDGMVRFSQINQAARWVRIQNQQRGGGPAEVQIWGRSIAGDKTILRKAYLQNNGATPLTTLKSEPVDSKDISPIFPIPQSIKMGQGLLPLRDGLTVAYEPENSERARITAEVLRDEMKACYGLTMQVAPASAAPNAAILVGEAQNSPQTKSALAVGGVSFDAKIPGAEGYVYFGNDKRIVIGGSDERGAFYGTQSLLSLVKRGANDGWIVPAAQISDRPDMSYRYIQGRPIPDKNLIRALARFRINYYEPQPRYLAQAAKWDAEASRYFVSFVPELAFNSIITKIDPNLTERAPNEDVAKLGTHRRNANPNHPRSWEIFNAEVEKWLPKFHGDLVSINWDETYMDSHGARWNVSKESRALNMTAGQLLAHTLNRIDKEFKKHGKTIVMHDTAFIGNRLSYPGDPDPDWNKALDTMPRDVKFLVWHPREVNDLLGSKGFDLLHLALDEKDWRRDELPGPYHGIAAYMAESAFTPARLLEIAEVTWNTKAPRPQDPDAVRAVSHFIPQWNRLYAEQRLPSTYARTEDYLPLDIQKAANLSRIDEVAYDGKGWVDMGSNVDLRSLPAGIHEMNGVPFRIINEKTNDNKSVVTAQNRGYVDRTMPTEVEVDIDNIKAASLLFLHCLDNRPGHNYLRRKELAGYYYMIYGDGTYAKQEIKYSVNTANWEGRPVVSGYGPKSHSMTDGWLAWQGDTASGMKAFLYATEWVNPHPEKAIQKIVLRTTDSISQMNPMLLAVTAVKPQLSVSSASTAPDAPLFTRLTSAKPQGTPLDLRGGKDESEKRYVAPDGTIIEAPTLSNLYADVPTWDILEFRGYVGMLNEDGNQFIRANQVFYTLPKPTVLTGVLVRPAYRLERKVEDFEATRYDIFLDVSDDGGATWHEVSKALGVSPEEQGAAWLPLDKTSIKNLRVRVASKSITSAGIGFIQLFQQPAK